MKREVDSMYRFAMVCFGVVSLSVVGCGDDASSEDDATFDEVFERVIADGGCATGVCHSTAAAGSLRLMTKAESYDELVGVQAAGSLCGDSGLTRVVPNNPDQSLLIMKLQHTQPCGDPMPITNMLDAEDIDLVRRWIAAGAPNN